VLGPGLAYILTGAVAHSSPAHGAHTQCGTTSQHAALLNNMLHTSQLTEGTLNITSR
jgi:hypothetical protein